MLADRKNADYIHNEDGEAESDGEISDLCPSILERADPRPPYAIW